jgi:hypothetical protein
MQRLFGVATFTLVALAVGGCYPNARWYEPVSAARVRQPYGEAHASSIYRDGSETVVRVRIHDGRDDAVTGRPRVTAADGGPCSSGIPAETWESTLTDKPAEGERGTHGTLGVHVSNDRTDREGLLLHRPTALDVPVSLPGSTGALEKQCLRLPLLATADGRPEWRQDPGLWIGLDLRIDGFLQRLSGIDSTVLLPISFGAFVGPFRAGLELAWGFAVGPGDARVATGGAGVIGAGARVDSPVIAVGRFATGLKLLYVVEGWTYGKDRITQEQVGVAVHGPRVALRFLLIPPTPPSSKYESRADAWSTGLEFGVTRLFLTSDGTAATALGGSYVGDIGW